MNKPKRKGTRKENDTVKWLQKKGLKAKRVPGSGAFEGLPGDVLIDMRSFGFPHDLQCEVKARESGLKMLAKWLGNNDILFIWRKYEQSPLIVMCGAAFDEFVEIMLR